MFLINNITDKTFNAPCKYDSLLDVHIVDIFKYIVKLYIHIFQKESKDGRLFGNFIFKLTFCAPD